MRIMMVFLFAPEFYPILRIMRRIVPCRFLLLAHFAHFSLLKNFTFVTVVATVKRRKRLVMCLTGLVCYDLPVTDSYPNDRHRQGYKVRWKRVFEEPVKTSHW